MEGEEVSSEDEYRVQFLSHSSYTAFTVESVSSVYTTIFISLRPKPPIYAL